MKYEGLNPTGSFKDRGMTVAVSKAMERGAKTLICASTGNTSAQALYEKCGFALVGRRRNYYSEPLEDALTMTAQLKRHA